MARTIVAGVMRACRTSLPCTRHSSLMDANSDASILLDSEQPPSSVRVENVMTTVHRNTLVYSVLRTDPMVEGEWVVV